MGELALIKKSIIYALIFGGIVAAVLEGLTCSFILNALFTLFGVPSPTTVLLFVLLGVPFGCVFFLLELFYIGIFKKALQTNDPEVKHIYKNKIIINSTVTLGMIFQCGYFALAIYSVFGKKDLLWTAFAFSAIFAAIAYVLYFGVAIAEACLRKRKRYLLKAIIPAVIGFIGVVTYGYTMVGSVIWFILSCAVFAFEMQTLFMKKPKSTDKSTVAVADFDNSPQTRS